jgi:aminopeptidase N
MILHMLRWVVGDQKFDQTMRDFYAKFAGKSATVDDFRGLTEKIYGDKLTWFFSQWLDSTGAPEFKTKYTIYRLGNGKGFRSVGQTHRTGSVPHAGGVENRYRGGAEPSALMWSGRIQFTVDTFGAAKVVIDQTVIC